MPTDTKDLTKDKSYNPEEQLSKIGISLPEVSAPVANYVRAVRTGNLLFLSGSGPKKNNGEYIVGKVGKDLSIEEGYQAARITGINHLATLKSELGNLNKVKRIVKVLGMVNSSPDFTDQPKVINGFSDLMVEVFGERGKHARSAWCIPIDLILNGLSIGLNPFDKYNWFAEILEFNQVAKGLIVGFGLDSYRLGVETILK